MYLFVSVNSKLHSNSTTIFYKNFASKILLYHMCAAVDCFEKNFFTEKLFRGLNQAYNCIFGVTWLKGSVHKTFSVE